MNWPVIWSALAAVTFALVVRWCLGAWLDNDLADLTGDEACDGTED